jgi:nuclear transcription Y subunit beta
MSEVVASSSSAAAGGGGGQAAEPQDRNLPLANISRIMKKVLPPNMKVTKDAMLEIQKCVSEFISFITSEAGEKCLNEKRKTLNGDDILYALLNMGFDNYSDVLQVYLAKYRESTKDSKAEKRASSGGGGEDDEDDEDEK